MPIHITEHWLRKYTTADGETVVTQVPELQGRPIFGPRMLAMIGWLKSRAHCSYSTIATWMDDVLQVPVCRGYLSKLCNGVEPTNNHTEQQVRHCVIDRRITQGTRTERGQRCHEHMWSAIATCTKQGQSFFAFLHSLILAHLAGERGPSKTPPKNGTATHGWQGYTGNSSAV